MTSSVEKETFQSMFDKIAKLESEQENLINALLSTMTIVSRAAAMADSDAKKVKRDVNELLERLS